MSQWLNVDVPELQGLRRDLEVANIQIRKLHSLLMNTRRHAYMASAIERSRAAGKPPRGLPEFRSQFGEDCLLYELFEGKQDGFFIEAGAFNGLDFSVSYAFEQLGWNGLLVEAIPERASECRDRRVHSRVVHAALGAPGGSSSATLLSTDDQYGGMLSHVETSDVPQGASTSITKRQVTVPRVTMNSLLQDHRGAIDFVVLDVEGAEAAVLSGFDLVNYRPRVLMVEDLSLGRDSALKALMASQPYTLMGWVEMNAVYLHNEEKALRERFVRMSVFGI